MKYKICKLVDGNGKEWYQIKIKWWIFWYNYEKPTYSNYDFGFWEFIGDRFDTPEEVREAINKLILQDKSEQVQLLECVEI